MGYADRLKQMSSAASQESEATEFRKGYLMGSRFDPDNLNDLPTREERELFGYMDIESAIRQRRTIAVNYSNDVPIKVRNSRNNGFENPTIAQLGYIAGRGIRCLKQARDPVITAAHNPYHNPHPLVERALCLLDATGQLETNDEVLGQLDMVVEYHQENGEFLAQLAETLQQYEPKLKRNTRQLSFPFMLE